MHIYDQLWSIVYKVVGFLEREDDESNRMEKIRKKLNPIVHNLKIESSVF